MKPSIAPENKYCLTVEEAAAYFNIGSKRLVYLLDSLAGADLLFSVKQISPFSSSEFPIVIVGKSPLSAGLVRKHVPLLHPAA